MCDASSSHAAQWYPACLCMRWLLTACFPDEHACVPLQGRPQYDEITCAWPHVNPASFATATPSAVWHSVACKYLLGGGRVTKVVMAASARPALYAAVVDIPERAALPFSCPAASIGYGFCTRRLSFPWQLPSEFQGVACTFLPWVDLLLAVPNACASHECMLSTSCVPGLGSPSCLIRLTRSRMH